MFAENGAGAGRGGPGIRSLSEAARKFWKSAIAADVSASLNRMFKGGPKARAG